MTNLRAREGSTTDLIFELTDGDGNGARLADKRVELVLSDKDARKEETRIFSNVDIPSMLAVGAENQKQTVVVFGASGTFKLQYGSLTTAAIAYNANASVIQSALEALTTIGSGKVLVTGLALPTGASAAVSVEFIGTLFSQSQPLLVGTTLSGVTKVGVTGKTVIVFKPQRDTFRPELTPYECYFNAIDANGEVKSYPESDTDGFFFTIDAIASNLIIR